MLKFILLLILTFTAVEFTNAATGCVPTSNTSIIYLQKTGANYRSNGMTASLVLGCAWIYNTPSTSCNVNGGIGGGFLAQDTPQACPIDDYTGLFLLLFAGIGYWIIANKKTMRLAVQRIN